jgi:LSD1 subclass zinc finger protein
MDLIKTICPACGLPLELPRDFDNVICASCGTAFQVRRHKDAINLLEIERRPDRGATFSPEPNGSSKLKAIELRLSELDEEIETLGAEIDAARSREQAAPLQAGCAFFGVFLTVIFLLSFFATVASSFFGGWVFYLSLAAVILFGLARMRGKLVSREQLARLREERGQMEELLNHLESERAGLRELSDSNLRDSVSSRPAGPPDAEGH